MSGRALLRVALLAAVASELVMAGPATARTLGGLQITRPAWVAVAVVAELASMHCFARTQRRMLRAGGARVPIGRMVGLTYAANALTTTLPGGTAFSAGYVVNRMRSWGVTASAAAFAVVASGVASVLTFAVLAVAGAALAGGTIGGSLTALASAAVLVGAAFALRTVRARAALVAVAERGLLRANRVLHRSPRAGLDAFRRTVAELTAIRPRWVDWAAGLGFAALNWLADLACLVASCAAVGVPRADLPLLVLAYLAGMGASGLSPLPGGLGVIDAAMILTLTGGGAGHTAAAACVLLYRAISLLLVVAVGWIAWSAAALRSRRTHPTSSAPTSSVPTSSAATSSAARRVARFGSSGDF